MAGTCAVCGRPIENVVMVSGTAYCSAECVTNAQHAAVDAQQNATLASGITALIGYAILFGILYAACRIMAP